MKWDPSLKIFKIRQLAAVELRKRILQKSGALWVNLPQDQRDQIKNKLPELIVREQKYVLRTWSLARFNLRIVNSYDIRLPG